MTIHFELIRGEAHTDEMSQRIAQLSIRAAEFLGGLAKNYMPKSSADLVEERIQNFPVDEVEQAEKAIKASGRALNDASALAAAAQLLDSKKEAEKSAEKRHEAKIFRNIGYGMMKRAVIRAATDAEYVGRVPVTVIKEAVERSIDLGADPNLQGFMTADEVEQFSKVYERIDKITVLPAAK